MEKSFQQAKLSKALWKSHFDKLFLSLNDHFLLWKTFQYFFWFEVQMSYQHSFQQVVQNLLLSINEQKTHMEKQKSRFISEFKFIFYNMQFCLLKTMIFQHGFSTPCGKGCGEENKVIGNSE